MFDRREFFKKLNEEIKKTQEEMKPPPEPKFYYESCNGCGSCLFVCPVMEFEDIDEARGEMSRAIQFSMGNTKAQPNKLLSECTLCGTCNEYCSRLAEPIELFKKLKLRV